MIFPSIDKLLNIVDSKYELALVVARRSREINETGFLELDESEYKSKKNIGRALEEVGAGMITIIKKK